MAPSGLKDQYARIALMYFILKTSEQCSENSKQGLIETINRWEVAANVSDFIQSNAKSLLITFKDNDVRLNSEKDKFFRLDINVQKALKKIEAFSSPFDPSMALEHYIDSQK